MQVFGDDNGCVVLAKVSVQKSRGAILSIGSGTPPSGSIVVGVYFDEKEKFAGLP